jgi:phenylpropionate dioxygenase-like ring-hydroxylating dioxygenase large terminal subunit
MFLQDNWYVAAFGADVTTKPAARKICGKPVVLFRTAGGEAVALEDRCAHRGMPLSLGGECEGEIIRCPYHGLEFDKTGRCVKVPGQALIPESAAVRHYPLVEQDALLWIWVGNRAKADAARIPRHPEHVDKNWAWTPIMLEIEADWQLLNDNLLDLTHLGIVHRKTIGGNMQAHATATMRTTKTERGVLVTRWLPNSVPPPQYLQAHRFTGNIDRWQEMAARMWAPVRTKASETAACSSWACTPSRRRPAIVATTTSRSRGISRSTIKSWKRGCTRGHSIRCSKTRSSSRRSKLESWRRRIVN